MDVRKILGQIVFIMMITSGISFANTNEVEVNAGRSALEGRFDRTMDVKQGLLTIGIGGVYNDDDYKIANVKLTLGNGTSFPELRFNLGFKGVLGDIEKGNRDGDLIAVGFVFLGAYSIPETIAPIPIDVSVGFSYAPDSLCFLDSDKYLDFRASLDFRIVKNAAIVLGYRYIEVRFDDNRGGWEMSDEALFVGYQLRF